MLQLLALDNYRNLTGEWELDPAGNLIIAPNASGKSNFLESIFLLDTNRLLRLAEDQSAAVGPVSTHTRIQAETDKYKLEINFVNESVLVKTVKLNDKKTTPQKLRGKLSTVLFAPHSVDLISGSPAVRRDDLDLFLAGSDPTFLTLNTKYHKILRNRNSLLRQLREHGGNQDDLSFWDTNLLELGIQVYEARTHFLQEIAEFVREMAQAFYHTEVPTLVCEYHSRLHEIDPDYGVAMRAKVEANRDKEIAVGQSLYGPHRDDYSFVYNGKDLRLFGSRGEQRLGVLIWKLAQAEYLAAKTGNQPLILLDDITSELDDMHRENVAEFLLSREYQFVLTAAAAEDVPAKLRERAKNLQLP